MACFFFSSKPLSGNIISFWLIILLYYCFIQFLNSPEAPYGKLTSTPVADKHKFTPTSIPKTSPVLNTPTINLDGRYV